MADLLKIKEVSSRYDVTARTLRYYEDMGLINSLRNDDYAYRMYDEFSIKRLEQILILRRLNISIKDIQRIFRSSGSEIVLEVLGKKVSDIDDEVALLHELKKIVLDFIMQIQGSDFQKDSDVKLLYEKAKEIEQQIINVGYEGNPSRVNSLVNITEKLKKAPEVRVVEIPRCRMVSSGYFNDLGEVLGSFDIWFSECDKMRKGISFSPLDFMFFEADGRGMWLYAVEDWVTEKDTNGYEIIEFEGGLYANAVSIDGDDDIGGRVYMGIKEWIDNSGFELDEREGHRTMCHMIVGEKMNRGLGYKQLDIFVPIKLRGE
ncbi:helix-turn-helix domain-containing protein [Ruminiclostridium cellobioparum]|uniref:helix-turn-helix domain-containing protein n=1 Tax=Ruminiclostridium cellobioparum TaxID=29355 RepID=UPI0028A75DB7|nr:MerR family transcriptional regulator [Ruminiclostridium cellobioparum]